MAKAAAPSQTPMPVDIMIGWLGTKEIKGPRANPIIAGKPTSWFSLISRHDVTSDEIANCAAGVGAAIVVWELLKAGLTYDDVSAAWEVEDKSKRKTAIQLLADRGVDVVLPPKDQRLLAQSYNSFGADARKDPRRGDIMVIRRGAAWQGHVMFIVSVNRQTGVAKCIGANQSDTTSYAEHHLSEAIAIRRYVPATVKDLRAAGSTAIARGDQQEAAGAALAVGVPAVTVAAKAIEGAVQPASDAAASLPQLAEQTGVLHTLTSTGVAMGNLVLQSPWLVGCVGAGILVWYLGRTGKLRRLASHIAGAPLSTQTS